MSATSSKKHNFNFNGGEHLRKICASFYVCYLYCKNIDPSETRWKAVSTQDTRIKNIIEHANFCNLWLEEISKMKRVGTNSMGLTVSEVNTYALKLLKLNTIKFE